MLTTTDDPREVERCYQLGCNVYITKPVDYEGFVEAIKRLGLFLQVVRVPRKGRRTRRGRRRACAETTEAGGDDPRSSRTTRGSPTSSAGASDAPGYAVGSPPTAAEDALRDRARRGRPVVLDYRLNGDDERAGLLRELQAGGLDVPSILVTGFSDEAMLIQAMRAGVRDFVPKTPDYLDYLRADGRAGS